MLLWDKNIFKNAEQDRTSNLRDTNTLHEHIFCSNIGAVNLNCQAEILYGGLLEPFFVFY